MCARKRLFVEPSEEVLLLRRAACLHREVHRVHLLLDRAAFDDSYARRGEDVQRQSAGHGVGHHWEEEDHHPLHHLLLRDLLIRHVGRDGRRHVFLLEIKHQTHEHGQQVDRSECEEHEIDRRAQLVKSIGRGEVGEEGPIAKALENAEKRRLLTQGKREVEHRVERHPNRHLRKRGQQTADATSRTHATLAEHAHLLLLHARGLVFEFLLQLIKLGLHRGHRARETLHGNLRLLLHRMEQGAHHHHQRDDCEAPVKDHVIVEEGEEPQHAIGEPREGAPRAATTHEIDDEVAHVEPEIGLGAIEQLGIEWSGENSKIK